MALKWTTSGKNIKEAKDLIDSCIKNARIPHFARITWENDELVVCVDNRGKSEFRFSLAVSKDGALFQEIRRDVALMHRPFVGLVENIVEKVLRDAGFKQG